MSKRTMATMVRIQDGYTTYVEAVAQQEPSRVVLYVAAVRTHSTVAGTDRGQWQQEYDTYEEAVVRLDDGLFNMSTIGFQLQMRAEIG